MPLNIRRFTLAAAAVLLLSSAATEGALAQGATVAPGGGGIGSSTAPSNSQGTPSGGTGVIGTTRVGPSAETASPAPVARARPRRSTRRARRSNSSEAPVLHAAPSLFG